MQFFLKMFYLPKLRTVMGWVMQPGIISLLLRNLKIQLELSHLRNSPQIAHCHISTLPLLLSHSSHTDKCICTHTYVSEPLQYSTFQHHRRENGHVPCFAALQFSPGSCAVGGTSSCGVFSYLCLSDRKSILSVLEDIVNDWRTGMFLSPKDWN